jgi:hypothetical protein
LKSSQNTEQSNNNFVIQKKQNINIILYFHN